MLLNIVSGVDKFGDHPISIERIHHEIEAGRLAYRDRNLYLADPEFSDVPVTDMLSSEQADFVRAQINPNKALDTLPDSTLPRHKSTVYISVIDKDRNACSFINTVFHNFGAGILAPKSGVILQNRGQGFVVEPGHPNCIEPGKRPLHTIIPGMATKDGKTVMSFGVMGGEYQAFGHMQFLTRLFDYGMDIQEAQDTPRFMPDPFSDVVEVEEPISNKIRDELRALGHNIQPASKPIGGSQAIFIDWKTGLLIAGSDPRKAAKLVTWITNGDAPSDMSFSGGTGADSADLTGTAAALTLAKIDAALLASYTDGGNPSMLVMSPTNKQNFSGLSSGSVATNPVSYTHLRAHET